MDLRDYYRLQAASITDEDMRKAALFLSDHIGKANAVSKRDLTLALYGKTTDSTERKARELNDRAFSLFNVRLPSPTDGQRMQRGLW